MELKKNQKADLKKLKGLFLNIGLTISMLVAILAFEWKTYDDSNLMQLGQLQEIMEEVIELPITKQPPPPPPVVKRPKIIEVPDEVEIEEIVEIELDVEIVEETIIEDVIFKEPVIEEDIDEVHIIVEQKPLFVGGDPAFMQFVHKNLKYPEKARRMGLEGRVFVKFIIERDGSLSDIGVLRGVGGNCNEEAIRVMNNSPLWIPGKQRGRPVRVQMIIPILFTLG